MQEVHALVGAWMMYEIVSNLRFSNCVDPFHEVKSKREKKKEVRSRAKMCTCISFPLFGVDFMFVFH